MEQKNSFQEPSQLKQTLLNNHQDFTFDTTNIIVNQEIQDPSSSFSSTDDDVEDVESEASAISMFFSSDSGRKKHFHRCKTAPAMTAMRDRSPSGGP